MGAIFTFGDHESSRRQYGLCRSSGDGASPDGAEFFACRVNSVNEFYSHLDCVFIIAASAGTNDHAAQYCVDWTVFLFDTLHHEPRV